MITSKYRHQLYPMPKKLYFGIYLTLVLFVYSFFIISQPAFAEREITLKKTVDVKNELLLETLSDLQSYPQIFPEFIKSVKLTDDKTAKFTVGSNGIFFDVQAQHIQYPDGRHVVEVISGDLKGSKIITTLQKTWGFDGTPNGGTRVNMEILLQTSGMLSLITPSISDEMILSHLDAGLEKLVVYAKTEPKALDAPSDKSLIKNDAKMWSKGAMDDLTFILDIRHMVRDSVTSKPQTQHESPSLQVPLWFKTNAGWWADGKISDEDFDSAIQYLISSKIIKI